MADSRVSVLIDIRSKLAGLEQATAGFGRLVKSVAGFTAAYLSVRSVISGARDIISLGADLDHLSTRTGLAVSSLSVLRQAFDDNGSSGERVGKTINDMQKKLSEAAQGTGEGRMALDQLGIKIEDIINLSPEKQFETLAAGIAKLKNPADRASVAMRLFGESGAELMPLFRSGGALDDARVSLGKMPEVLERNSVQFERIDTLLGRMPNKSRQVFAGIGDMLADELLAPLEAINQIDFTGFGQRIGAFVDLAIDAFRDGKLAEFIGLTIEAGFEQGTAAARSMIDEALAWLGSGGQGWKVVLSGVMTFGTEAAKALIDALATPVTWLSTGFRKIGEEARVIFQQAANFLSQGFESVINAITAGFENLLNKVIERVNAITAALPFTDGAQIGQVSFGRINWKDQVVEPAKDFSELLKEQSEGVEAVSSLVKDQLNANLQASREILGLSADEAERELTAAQRLNELIEQQIALREQRQRDAAPQEGQTPLGEPAGSAGGFTEEITALGNIATETFNAVDSALRGGLSQSIEGLVTRTRTWQDALLNISATVRGSLIQAFSQMAAQWIADRLRMFVMGESLKQAETTSTVAQETTKQAALQPTALLASIGSYGAAALIGAAVLTAVLASVGGFAEGGYTGHGGKYEPAGVVHRGEFVIPADVVSRRGPAYFEGLVSELRVQRPTLPAMPGFAEGGLAGPQATTASTAPAGSNVNIAVTGTRNDLRRFLETAEGEAVVLDIMSRNKLRIGVPG